MNISTTPFNKFKYPGSVLLVSHYVGKHSAVEAMGGEA